MKKYVRRMYYVKIPENIIFKNEALNRNIQLY